MLAKKVIKKLGAKPYVVRFKYSVEEEASINIGATSPEAAKEAAIEMLATHPLSRVLNPEILSVSEYQQPGDDTPATTLQ